MLKKSGLSLDEFAKRGIGPILFREELIYHREIGLDEKITVNVELTKLNTSNFRFSFRHKIYKENGVKAATINVDGAWLNLQERKLISIPEDWVQFIDKIPRSDDYQEV